MIKWGIAEIELLKNKYLELSDKVKYGEEVTQSQSEMVNMFKELNMRRQPSQNIVDFFDMLYEIIMEELRGN